MKFVFLANLQKKKKKKKKIDIDFFVLWNFHGFCKLK